MEPWILKKVVRIRVWAFGDWVAASEVESAIFAATFTSRCAGRVRDLRIPAEKTAKIPLHLCHCSMDIIQ
jgi:hypothetical protein